MSTSTLTAAHYRAQLAVRAQAVRDAHLLWKMYDPQDRDSFVRMLQLAIPIARARHQMSAGLAASYFKSVARTQIKQAVDVRLPPELPSDRVSASLIATGLVGTIRALSVGQSQAAALQNGFVRFSGGLSRLALEGGRDTLVASTAASPRASHWTRVTGPAPCDFCAGLVSQTSSSFAAHDHCSCTAQPTFG